MRLSAKTLERLTEIVTGNSQVSPYRSGPQLIEFFRDFGEDDTYGTGFGSRAGYALAKLNKFNGTETIKGITSVPTLIKQIQLVSGTLGEKSVEVLVK